MMTMTMTTMTNMIINFNVNGLRARIHTTHIVAAVLFVLVVAGRAPRDLDDATLCALVILWSMSGMLCALIWRALM